MKRLDDAVAIECAATIDRERPLQFTFDGKSYQGYQGDTLASALLANEVFVIGRSFKLHRPRGLLSAGVEEANAIVQVGEGDRYEVNARATQVELYDGLVARSQNSWPSARFDLSAIYDRFSKLLPAGFYSKTFMWPNWHWYEGLIRRAAGLGRIGGEADPDRYVKRFAHCDVLVVGGGPAGIAAALSAAQTSAQVILLDDQTQFGGSLHWENERINGSSAQRWVKDSVATLAVTDNVRLLLSTMALGYYDDNFLTAAQTLEQKKHAIKTEEKPRQRFWKIRAHQVVLATGAIERPLVFPNNDRPGIMLASAVRQYANRYAVAAGKRVALFTNNDFAYRTALDLHKQGVEAVAIIDVRSDMDSPLVQQALDCGIRLLSGYGVIATRGRKRIKRVQVAPLNQKATAFTQGKRQWIDCDLLAMSGGWNPVVHLYSQAGGKLKFDDAAACFIPDQCEQAVRTVGAVSGAGSLQQCLQAGHEGGRVAAAVAGVEVMVREASASDCPQSDAFSATNIQPYWQTPSIDGKDSTASQWVDFLHDVTVADIDLSARENFQSVEHLKRYTTAGMAVDQGKTSNINALAVMGQATHRTIPEVGTTKFRPPYHPVTIGTLAGNRVGELAHRYRRLPVSWHQSSSAVFEDHSGWLRPAYYPNPGETEQQAIEREVRAARNGVALFDSSSLGKIEVRGTDAAEFLNRLYINNVKSLKVGRVRYGMMLNENGTIIDDGVFACLAENHYLVTTSSAGALTIYAWMEEWLQCEWPDLDVMLTPLTAQWATLTVSGPKARDLLAKLDLGVELSTKSFPHMSVRNGQLDGVPIRVFRVSFTGEVSYELNIAADYAESLWQLLLSEGADDDITPLGMEALDRLRVEKGYLEVGVDTDRETTPLDVGWAVPISKKTADFLGRRSLSRSHDQRQDRHQLVGVKPRDTALVVPVGTHLLDERSNVVGHVTSSSNSSTLGISIAMAMIKEGESLKGQSLSLSIEGSLNVAQVADLSFYDPQGERFNV